MASSNQGGSNKGSSQSDSKGSGQSAGSGSGKGSSGSDSKGSKQSGGGGNSNASGSKQSDSSNRGFASMDPEQQREIAAEGGRAAHASGNAHEFTPEEARKAGAMSHKGDGNQQSGSGSKGEDGGKSGGGSRQSGSGGSSGGSRSK